MADGKRENGMSKKSDARLARCNKRYREHAIGLQTPSLSVHTARRLANGPKPQRDDFSSISNFRAAVRAWQEARRMIAKIDV